MPGLLIYIQALTRAYRNIDSNFFQDSIDLNHNASDVSTSILKFSISKDSPANQTHTWQGKGFDLIMVISYHKLAEYPWQKSGH